MSNSPEETLVHAIMNQAVHDGDVDYFNGDLFEIHCGILGADSFIIREQCLKRIVPGTKGKRRNAAGCGSTGRYRAGCRCEICCEAARVYQRAYRVRKEWRS